MGSLVPLGWIQILYPDLKIFLFFIRKLRSAYIRNSVPDLLCTEDPDSGFYLHKQKRNRIFLSSNGPGFRLSLEFSQLKHQCFTFLHYFARSPPSVNHQVRLMCSYYNKCVRLLHLTSRRQCRVIRLSANPQKSIFTSVLFSSEPVFVNLLKGAQESIRSLAESFLFL